DAGRIGPAVDEVADEDRLPPGGRPRDAAKVVGEPREQLTELLQAAVNVADHVERAALGAQVRPERPALDHGGLDVFGGLEDADPAGGLAGEAPQRTAELAELLGDHVRPEASVRAVAVSFGADLPREVED